jgi:RND family efflux transporter MFP subunit
MKKQAFVLWRPRTRRAMAFGILLASIAGCKESEQPPPSVEVVRPVKTLVVSTPNPTAGIELPGQVRATQQVDLSFKDVSGRLAELPIAGREGKEVMKGELLAQIDAMGFETALSSAESSLSEAYSVLDLTRAENERMEKMKGINPDLVSDSMVSRTREKLKQAEARLKSLEAKVMEAEKMLEHSSLRAPFTGVIVRPLVESQQKVKAGQPIVSLRDITHLEVLIDAPETMMAAVQSLGPNSFSAAARFPQAPGREFPLALKETTRLPDPATQTYQMVLEMPRPKEIDLPPGTTGTVTVSGKGPGIGKGRILIPAIAVLTDPDGKSYVWLVSAAELRTHRRDIRMGRLAASDQVQVLDGLEGGERIVVAGVRQLAEGRQVRLWEEQDSDKAQ